MALISQKMYTSDLLDETAKKIYEQFHLLHELEGVQLFLHY